jgi:hypothetical protein
MTNRIRTIRNALCASAAAFVLHACATAPERALTADDLLTAPYALQAGAPFDIDALFAALPGWLAVEHGPATFDAAIGAMVVSDLRIAMANAPDAGIVAARAVIWGGDPGAAQAVFSGGARLADMTPLFDRLTLEGVRSEGLQWEVGTENASLSIGKLVIDGLSARPYALEEKPGANEEGAVLRNVAAVMGSFAYDGAAYSDFALRLHNSQGDAVEMKVAEAFSRGYDAGAVDYQSARGVYALVEGLGENPLVEVAASETREAAANNPYAKILNKPPVEAVNEMVRHPAAFLADAVGGVLTEYEIDFTEARGADMSGAYAWLARWELPPITETDLIDLGAQTMLGYRQIVNGRPVYTIDRAEVAAADFHWLIPSRYDVAYRGLTYDMGAMFEEMRNGMAPGFSTETAPQMEQFREALSALGLERISGDMDFSWRWNGDTGAAALSMSSDFVDVAANTIGVRAAGPSLARWDAMARNETQIAAAAGEIALEGLNYSITDKGFLGRIFDYAAAKNGAGTGPELRQSVTAMVRLSSLQSAEMNPRLPSYAMALADFLERGGTISLLAAPSAPVSVFAIQAASQGAPQTLPDMLNITMTHTDQ